MVRSLVDRVDITVEEMEELVSTTIYLAGAEMVLVAAELLI